LANEKFQDALSKSPNSTSTLYEWGKLLHSMALRCYSPQTILSQLKIPQPNTNITNSPNTNCKPLSNVNLQRETSSDNSSSAKPITNNPTYEQKQKKTKLSQFIPKPNEDQKEVPSSSSSSSNPSSPLSQSLPPQNVDYSKAEEYFTSSEEKYTRAYQISPNNRVSFLSFHFNI
jgi:hypothetical protein